MRTLVVLALLVSFAPFVSSDAGQPACTDDHAWVGSGGQYYDLSATYGVSVWTESNGVDGLQRGGFWPGLIVPSDNTSCADVPGAEADTYDVLI